MWKEVTDMPMDAQGRYHDGSRAVQVIYISQQEQADHLTDALETFEMANQPVQTNIGRTTTRAESPTGKRKHADRQAQDEPLPPSEDESMDHTQRLRDISTQVRQSKRLAQDRDSLLHKAKQFLNTWKQRDEKLVQLLAKYRWRQQRYALQKTG